MIRASLLLLVMLAASACAQQGGSVDATITITQALTEGEEITPPRGNTDVLECSGGKVDRLPVGTGYRFSENHDENGCMEIIFEFPLHREAARHEVRLTASRSIVGGNSGATVNMIQDYRIYDGAVEVGQSSIFASGSRDAYPTEIAFDASFPSDNNAGKIGFYFEDATTIAPIALPAGYRFSATISDVTVASVGIPLAVAQEHRDRAEENGDTLVEVIVAEVDLTPATLALGDVSLQLLSPNRFDFDHIVTPDGYRLRDVSYVETETQGSRTITVPSDVIAAHGPGTYSAMYVQRETLVVSKGMLPVAATMILLPTIAGIVADRSAVRLGRHTLYGGPLSERGRYLLAPVALVYVFTAAWIMFGHWRSVTAWPLPASGMVALAILAWCAAAFLVIGYILKRHLVRVLEREREVTQQAHKELERSNKDLEAFAYAASHDLQEPLRKIVTYNQLVQMRHGEKLDDEAKQFLGIAVDAGKRMQNFIQGLLQYSRAGSADLPREDVDCDEVVLEVLADLEAILEEADAEVNHSDLPVIRAPRSHVRALFQNLLQNAVRYRDPERKLRVEMSAERVDGAWRIQVKDNGPGIEDRDRQRIFEPFTRGRSGRDGSGLGLAICRRIVEYGGGRMGVDSEVGKGATFWFTWPDNTTTSRIPDSAWPRTRPRPDETAPSQPTPQ